MKKHRSISFMMWPIILGLVGVAVTVSTIPDMTPEQLAAELHKAQEEERINNEIAAALFSTSNRLAMREVRP